MPLLRRRFPSLCPRFVKRRRQRSPKPQPQAAVDADAPPTALTAPEAASLAASLAAALPPQTARGASSSPRGRSRSPGGPPPASGPPRSRSPSPEVRAWVRHAQEEGSAAYPRSRPPSPDDDEPSVQIWIQCHNNPEGGGCHPFEESLLTFDDDWSRDPVEARPARDDGLREATIAEEERGEEEEGGAGGSEDTVGSDE